MGKLDDMRKALREGPRVVKSAATPKPKPVPDPPKPAPPSKKVVVPKSTPAPVKPDKPIKVEAVGDFITHACSHRVGLAHHRGTKCPSCARQYKPAKTSPSHKHADKRLPDGAVFVIDPFVAETPTTPAKWSGTLTVPGFPPFAATNTGLWALLRHLDRLFRDAQRVAEVPADRVLAKDMPPQPGDDDPVDPQKPDGPRWGELFGRPRADKLAE